MKRRGLQPMHDQHINVTPLIDVIMCLIIFFLLCGQLAMDESNDKVRIPRAELGQELPEQRGRLLVNLVPHLNDGGSAAGAAAQEPDVIVRGSRVPIANLANYLRKEKQDNPDLKVILRADEGLTYDWISPVLVSCAQADIRSVNFSTRKQAGR